MVDPSLLGAAGLAGLLPGIATRRRRNAGEAEAGLEIPVLGVLPAPTRRSERARAAACANLVARPELEADLRGSLLMVTSCGRRAAASEVAADLAGKFAERTHRVLLVQADLGPDGAGDPVDTPGLTTVLAGRETLCGVVGELQIVNADGAVSYSVISSGPRVGDPGALLRQPALGRILTQARIPFDIVVVDSGAVVPASDTTPLARVCDYILLVTERRRAIQGDIEDARRALGALYEKVVGVAVQSPRHRGRRLARLPV